MHSHSGKKEKNISLLISNFNQKGLLSIEDLKTILGISQNNSRSKVYSYIKELEEHGYKLKKETIKNKIYYSLNAEKDNLHLYESLSYDTLRKYEIVKTLNNGPLDNISFAANFTSTNMYLSEPSIEPILLDIGKTRFYTLKKELLSSEDILELNGILYPTGKNIPLFLSLSEEELFELNEELKGISPGTPYYKNLQSVADKTRLILGEQPDYVQAKSNYLILGHQYNGFARIRPHLINLMNYDYRRKALIIEYMTNKQTLISVTFCIGIIVYSVEKDSMYLIGKCLSSDSESFYSIVNIEKITNITISKEENTEYNSSVYSEDIITQMFSISISEPVNVKVRFDDFSNIKRKIEYLSVQRPKSRIEYDNGYIYYFDTIRGLDDFANYLRQFGKSCYVIEPCELKDMMRMSIDKTLSRYSEVNHER